MTLPQPNIRRAYKTGSAPSSSTLFDAPAQPAHHLPRPALSLDSDRVLKKSATFHSPKSPSSDEDPIIHIPSLSRRSPTSTQALQDAVAAGEERISRLIGSFDRSLSGLETFSTDSQETVRRADESPLPRFMLRPNVSSDPDRMDLDPPSKIKVQRRHHPSDSGIGSTVTESIDDSESFRDADDLTTYKKSIPSMISGINGAGQAGTQHALSAYACRQIQKYIILPILKEQSLKTFHPLVTGIPVRVGRKEITCLRDLEKVLLWLAPRFAESRSSFLEFCDTSIQCLHTTVEHLNEADQRRPTDKPYSNAYFLDLTEQVRQYAAMISAARERIASGEARQGDHETLASEVSLEGGLGRTGQRAQLIRTNNGQSISLATGEVVDIETLRREAGVSDSEELDDDLLLSMARRRKNATERIVHHCAECKKEFKRPCDLTKHEKTHSRPWKCSDAGCKYAEYGWPTEKERDRHVNDKHSAAPAMFKCQFHPCPYESKRESNCKQHMEKAHGWAYVRSKNNGKAGKRVTPPKKSPVSPAATTTSGSHIFEPSGSEFDDSSTSPYMAFSSSDMLTSADGSVADTSPHMSVNAPFTPSPYEPNLPWDRQNPVLTPQSPFSGQSHRPSIDSSMTGTSDPSLPSATLTGPGNDLDVPLFNDTFDWSNLDTGFQSMNIQLFTPATSIDSHPAVAGHSRQASLNVAQPLDGDQKLSPGAQGALMLYSTNDALVADEGFDDFLSTNGKQKSDFALFDDTPINDASLAPFHDLPPFQSQTWAPQVFENTPMDE